jgi:hypothetical protein
MQHFHSTRFRLVLGKHRSLNWLGRLCRTREAELGVRHGGRRWKFWPGATLQLCSVALLSAALLSGCGGSPTAPRPVPDQSATAASPAPDPHGPAPGPPEPAPTPTPTPPPAPSPDPEVTLWRATTAGAHWYGAPVLPEAFDVEIRGSQLIFGPLTAEILARDSRSVFARPNGANLQLLFNASGGGTWTYNGVPGTANGSLSRTN